MSPNSSRCLKQVWKALPIHLPLQLQICRNGLIQFDLEWPFSYPYKFGARYWLDGFAMIAPYWALTDTYWGFKRRDFYRFQYYYSPSEGRYTYTWTFHRVDPNRWSSVYYQVYDTYSQEPKAENMLAKASEDVRKYHGQAGFADFEATWVLVVTWVKLYPLDWYYYDRKQDIYSDKVRRCVFFLTQSLKCFELLDVSEYLPCPLRILFQTICSSILNHTSTSIICYIWINQAFPETRNKRLAFGLGMFCTLYCQS